MLRSQVAGLLVRDDRILLCLRSATRAYYPAVWDFPGGHVEPGETGAAALRRELEEELGIVVPEHPGPPLAHIVNPVLGFDLKLWVVRDWRGNPENLRPDEHDAIAWLSPDEAAPLPLAHPEYGALIGQALART